MTDGAVTPAGAAVQGKQILVIDDEEGARTLLERYLNLDKHRVETADSGGEGIDRFRRGKFDLVITDRAMEDMSGDQVVAAIRTTDARIPILMLTGFGDIMNESGQYPAGVNLILSKPVTQAILREGLSKLMTVDAAALRS